MSVFKTKKYIGYVAVITAVYLFFTQYSQLNSSDSHRKASIPSITQEDDVLIYFQKYNMHRLQENSAISTEYAHKPLMSISKSTDIFRQYLDKVITLLKDTDLSSINLLDSKLDNSQIVHGRSDWLKEASSIINKDFLDMLTIKNLGPNNTKKNKNKIQSSHSKFVNNIPQLTERFYSGKGYVMLGGYKENSWRDTISLMALVRSGAKYPTEIMIFSEEDYETDLCGVIANSYNAKCVKVYEILGNENMEYIMSKTKTLEDLKVLAILLSSFQDVMYINPNTFTINNPDVMFNSKVYQIYKMITWPDFERRTTSPLFYDVSKIKIDSESDSVRYLNDMFTFHRLNGKLRLAGEEKRYAPKGRRQIPNSNNNFHDKQGTIPDWSTFDDLIIINKVKFFDTLLLALYYTMNGHNVYYPLLSQVVIDDEMDLNGKEAIVAAANFFGVHYYQLFKRPETDYKDGVSLGVFQFNPDEDYNVYNQVVEFVASKDEDFFTGKLSSDSNNENEVDHSETDTTSINQFANEMVSDIEKLYTTMFQAGEFKSSPKKIAPLFFTVSEANKESTNPFAVFQLYKSERENYNLQGNNEHKLAADKHSGPGSRKLSMTFPRGRFDYEQYIWRIVKLMFCEENLTFKQFNGLDRSEMCTEFVDAHIAELDKNEEEIASLYFERVA